MCSFVLWAHSGQVARNLAFDSFFRLAAGNLLYEAAAEYN